MWKALDEDYSQDAINMERRMRSIEVAEGTSEFWRAADIDAITSRIGRKRGGNDDVVAILESYSDNDLRSLRELTTLTHSRNWDSELLSLVLEEDLPLSRTVFNHVDEVKMRKITVQEITLIVSGLRYIGAMTEGDEDCPTLSAHIAIAKNIFRDRYEVPYHQDDDFMSVVQDFPDRLDDIRRYRMDRGKDSGGLREYLNSASRALAEGAL